MSATPSLLAQVVDSSVQLEHVIPDGAKHLVAHSAEKSSNASPATVLPGTAGVIVVDLKMFMTAGGRIRTPADSTAAALLSKQDVVVLKGESVPGSQPCVVNPVGVARSVLLLVDTTRGAVGVTFGPLTETLPASITYADRTELNLRTSTISSPARPVHRAIALPTRR